MRSRGIRWLAVLAGLAGSVVAGWLAVRNVDYATFADALRASDYRWLAPALAVLAVGIFLRALRWRLLFAAETRPPVGATARALLVGYFFNNVLPVRAGEAIRVLALHREAGTSRAEAIGTAVTERIYDVLVLLALLFVAVPWLPDVTWLRRAVVAALVFALGLAVLVAVLLRWGERPLRFALRPLALVPGLDGTRVETASANVLAGLAAIQRPRVALPALAFSVVPILVIAFSFWLVTLGFDLDVPFGAALLVMITTNLAMIVPSSAAAIGVFEASTVLALRAYGVDYSHALSYAVVLHAVNFVPFVVAGALVLPRYRRGRG